MKSERFLLFSKRKIGVCNINNFAKPVVNDFFFDLKTLHVFEHGEIELSSMVETVSSNGKMGLLSNSLSCISQDYATDFDPNVTVLSKYDFIVPGMGLKPGYCGRPYVNGLFMNGSGAHVSFTHCKKMECPDCSDLWRLQTVFTYTVLIEAFARYCGSRPCKGNYSINPYQEFTLEAIRKFNRNGKDRLKYQGMFAGLYMFHGFRIFKQFKPLLTKLTGGSSSSGHWNYILNEDNIPEINKHLKFKISSWYDLVYLAPHNHFIGFPGNVIITGDKKGNITIKKESAKIEGVEVWELQNVESVFKYIMYLSSHITQLGNDSKSHIKTVNPFGELQKMNLLDMVTLEELKEIRVSVLEVVNRNRIQKFEIRDDDLVYAVSEEKKVDFIPISHFYYRSLEGQENAMKLINYLYGFCPENAHYYGYLIKTYNAVRYCREVPQKFKRLFLTPIECDLEDMPDFVKNLSEGNPVKQMFVEGLQAPPCTFTFYFNSRLSNREHAVKDQFKPGLKIDNKGLEQPEIINPDSGQGVEIEQVIKPDIRIDAEFIASMERKFIKLSRESYSHAETL